MSEQELYMMSDDRGKDEFTSQNLRRKHEAIEAAIRDYNKTINQLEETAKSLVDENVTESEKISHRQADVNRLYSQLNEMATDRRSRLNEALDLFKLNREIEDLMQWISERDAIANSHELGQDLGHVVMLRERFKQFAKDTEKSGSERVERVNQTADKLILAGHADKSMIANWKDMLEEAWADLLEMIKTRSLELTASHRLHQFFHDCRELNSRISEKQSGLNDDVGRDAASVAMSQRKHENFEQELQSLKDAVESISKESAELQTSYAGNKANEIRSREEEVTSALKQLLSLCESRRKRLAETADLFKFLNKVRELMTWMEDVVRQMNTSEKPRDVHGVEQLINNHKTLKSEIESKQALFDECERLGNELLSSNHYASGEINEKLDSLRRQRKDMLDRWDERSEHLDMILEVYRFARDAAIAEAWLVAQDPYLLSTELGHTIEEVLELIKKHEQYEKNAAAQHEHFVALQKPTTFEIRELQLLEEERARSRSRDPSARAATVASSRLRSPSDGSQTELSSITERGVTSESIAKQKRQAEIARSSRPGEGVRASTRSVSALRSRSPFNWLRRSSRSLGGLPPSELDESSDGARPEDDGGLYRGFIHRKHVWETFDRQASNRSWTKHYHVVKPGSLCTYKDQKNAKQDKTIEDPIDLSGATVEEAKDYKRRHCFKLKLVNGNEYIFKAKDDQELAIWIDSIRTATGELESTLSGSSSRAQTLPASSAVPEKKKGTFFTLKRK